MSKTYLDEAIVVGDELVRQAKLDKNGVFWLNITKVHSKFHIEKKSNSSIVDGTAGVLLFLQELYSCTGSEEYLRVIRLGGSWLEHNYARSDSQGSLLAGELGVAFVLARVSALTGEQHFLDKALFIAQRANIEKGTSSCFLHGVSGAVLVFANLYAYSKQEWLVEKVNRCLEQLWSNAIPTSNGIYWNLGDGHSSSALGILEGTSGIGLLLLELSYHYKQPLLFWLVEQTLTLNFDVFKSRQNRLDNEFNIVQKLAIERSLIPFVGEEQYQILVGILTTAARMNEFFPQHAAGMEWVSRVSRPFENLRPQKESRIYTLSNGRLFEAMSIWLVDDVLKAGKLKAQRIDTIILENKRQPIRKADYPYPLDSEDYGLLRGSTGYGYACIRFFKNGFAPLLATDLTQVKDGLKISSLSDDDSVLNRIVVSKFSRTLRILQMFRKDREEWLVTSDIQEFTNQIREYVEAIRNDCLTEIFNLETHVVKLGWKIPILLAAYDKREDRGFDYRDDAYIKDIKLKLLEESIFFKAKWSWESESSLENNINLPADRYYYVIAFNGRSLREYKLEYETYILLKQFRDANKPRNILERLTKEFNGGKDKIFRKSLEARSLLAIRKFYSLGILVIV